MAAGDFTPAQLATVKVKLNEFWADARTQEDPTYSIETVRAISENQRVSTAPLNNTARCQDVSVVWLKLCDDSVAATTTSADCAITGAEMEAVKKDYAPNYSKQKTFMVWNDDCKGMFSYEEKMAEGFFKAFQSLEKDADKTAMVFLDTNASANLYTGTYGTIAGNETTFTPEQWNAKMMSHLALTAQYNNIGSQVFVSGTNMWEEWWNSQVATNELATKDNLLRLRRFGSWYFDPRIMDATLAENATFLFDSGDVAFFNKRMYDSTIPVPQGDPLNTRTFSVASERLFWRNNGVLMPVYFDVATQVACKKIDGTFFFGTKVVVTLKGGFITSGAPCDASTGILKFLNVPA